MPGVSHILWKDRPASRYEEAFPCGNGIVGAMMYGGVDEERILVNRHGFFLPVHHPDPKPVSRYLPRIRELLLERTYQEADEFYKTVMTEHGFRRGIGHDVDPLQPVLDLHVRTAAAAGEAEGYRASLDLETGVSTVRYRLGSVDHVRNLFVSRAHDVVVFRMRSSRRGALSCRCSLVPHPLAETRGAPFTTVPFDPLPQPPQESEWLSFAGRHANAREFGGVARVIARGGRRAVRGAELEVSGADEVLVLLSVFISGAATAEMARLRRDLVALEAEYEALLAPHAALHAELFNRVRLDLGEPDERSNGDLLAEASAGHGAPTALVRRLFEYGRYLTISSSRAGGFPVTLQGVWNGTYWPLWDSDYHLDENVEMCYWPSLPGSLPETVAPYVSYFESLVGDWQRNAREILGCRGVYASGIDTSNGRIEFWDATWVSGAGWVAQLFYDYYLFTRDREFLREHVVPFLKQIALFYEDFLIEDCAGRLMFVPSHSPENFVDGRILHINPTMDVAVCREVLTHLCSACEELGVEADGRGRWKRILERLPAYAVNQDGALAEWIHPDYPDNYPHRHLSHLYPLFPGLEITEEGDPRLHAAARVALDRRNAINTSDRCAWMFPHYACAYARLGEGDKALQALEELLRKPFAWDSFFMRIVQASQHKVDALAGALDDVFQADVNYGFTAAVLEMLVFSAPGIIKLLPALPSRWVRGSIAGVSCRGGIRVDVRWDMEERRLAASLVSMDRQEVTLKLPRAPSRVTAGASLAVSLHGASYRSVVLPAGETVALEAAF